MSDLVIETRDLTRCFGDRAVVSGLDLQVPRGGVFAFLGRNGAGKTTTIRLLLGLLEPTRGVCRVLGHESASLPPDMRGRIGYLAEGHHLPGWMTVGEVARFQASFFPQWSVERFTLVSRHFSLDVRARTRSLSRGERAGLCLALTLAQQPEVLILDDPTIGLDPVARRALLEAMLLVTRAADRTIFFSSHILADVERVADRVAILDQGALRVSCPTHELLARVGCWSLRFAGDAPELPALPGLVRAHRARGELQITLANPTPTTEARLATLGAIDVSRVPLTFEEVVLAYLGDRAQTTSLLESVEVAV